MHMEWLEDRHTVTAAEAAYTDVGRAWNWQIRKWEDISNGAYLSRSLHSAYDLLAVNIRIYNSSGSDIRGRVIQYGVVGDPLATDRVIRLYNGRYLTGGHIGANWLGKYPFCAGFYYRIAQGGTHEDEVIVAKIGYMRHV